jgi:myxalamid-type polyketide synthase MxaC
LRLLCDASVRATSLAPLTLLRRDPAVSTALRLQFCRKFGVNDGVALPESAAAAAGSAAARSRVAELVARVLAVDAASVPLHSPLRQLGVDSFLVTELTDSLSDEFNVKLPISFLFSHTTVAAVAAYLGEHGTASLDADDDSSFHSTRDRADHVASATAVIGVACCLPSTPVADGSCSMSVSELGDLLAAGTDCIGPSPTSRKQIYQSPGGFVGDAERFDAEFFGIAPREACELDPQQRLLLSLCWRCFEDAGVVPSSLRGSRTGVFVGIWSHDYERLMVGGAPSPYIATGNSGSVAAGRLSYTFGLVGPSIAVDTACSSSLVALHLAQQSLLSGECDYAVVAGVNLLLDESVTRNLASASMLSPDSRCKTFDVSADGYVRSEGAVVLLLQRHADAMRSSADVRALVRGTAVNHDGRSASLTAPSGVAQEAVIRAALARAGVAADDIDVVEAHGTGTRLGDPIELDALASVFNSGTRRAPLVVGSIKASIGHTEACAGLAGLVKLLDCFVRERIPRQLHFSSLNPLVAGIADVPIVIPTAPRPWPRRAGHSRLAGLSSFGFGGTNAHVVLEEPPLALPSSNSLRSTLDSAGYIFVVSARSRETLSICLAAAIERVRTLTDDELCDVCVSSVRTREHFAARVAFVVDSASALRERLQHAIEHVPDAALVHTPPHAVVFVCAPFRVDVAQVASLRRLYPTFDATFRSCMSACAALGVSIDTKQADGSNAVLLCAATLFATHSLLVDWNIVPTAVAGVNFGEIIALSIAGSIALHQAFRLCLQLQARAMDGVAMDVVCSEDALGDLLRATPSACVVIRYSDARVLVGVPKADVSQFVSHSVASGASVQVSDAPLCEPGALQASDGAAAWGEVLHGYRAAPTHVVSSASDVRALFGALPAGSLLIDPSHGGTVAAVARRSASFSGRICASTHRALDLVHDAFAAGVDVNWSRVFDHYCHAPLPHYPLTARRHWFVDAAEPPANSFHLSPSGADAFDGVISLASLPYLADHIVMDTVVFPFTGYVEIVLECLQLKFRGAVDCFVLTDFVVNKLMPVTADVRFAVALDVHACTAKLTVGGVDAASCGYSLKVK